MRLRGSGKLRRPCRLGRKRSSPLVALSNQLAGQIIELIRAQGWKAGHHLREQFLADSFRVSRQPVREALKIIERMGIVEQFPNRGYFLKRSTEELASTPALLESVEEGEAYLVIAEDRLAGHLPDRVSEKELMRRYELSKSQLTRVFNRMVREGWIERLPGHGWGFLPMLTSVSAYDMGYRFRATIEPAALLEPSFKISKATLQRARDQQQALLDGDLLRLSAPELFQANAEFHETLVTCSGNPFFIDALKRVNRLRRLIEYRKATDLGRLAGQCREHLQILEMLEQGDRKGAADFLTHHLDHVRQVKLRSGIDRPPKASDSSHD